METKKGRRCALPHNTKPAPRVYNPFIPREKKAKFAIQLRRNMTPAEEHLWFMLRTYSRSKSRWIPVWRPQVVICGWIVDFFCDETRVAIEVDGPTHDVEEDARRDSVLAEHSVRVLRFTNQAIYTRLDSVIRQIEVINPHGTQEFTGPI